MVVVLVLVWCELVWVKDVTCRPPYRIARYGAYRYIVTVVRIVLRVLGS